MQLLMDYLLSALYVMTMRNGHRATWIAWATVFGRGLDKQYREREEGRERGKERKGEREAQREEGREVGAAPV